MGAAVWLRRGNKKHTQPSRLHSRVGHSWGILGVYLVVISMVLFYTRILVPNFAG